MISALSARLARYGAVAYIAGVSMFGAVSPFVREAPKAELPSPISGEASLLEEMQFTGMFSLRGEVIISLYNPKTKQSIWVPLNGVEDGFSVSGYDSLSSSVTVGFGGRSRLIEINENEIIAMKVVSPPARSNAERTAVGRDDAPAPRRAPSSKDPETAQQEKEALNFMSDLLNRNVQARERFLREREQRQNN